MRTRDATDLDRPAYLVPRRTLARAAVGRYDLNVGPPLFLACLLAAGDPGLTEPMEGGPLPGSFAPHVGLQEENDLFGLIQLSDDDYTHGLHVDGAWRPDRRFRLFRDAGVLELWGLSAGQDLYTPTHLWVTNLALLSQDRPYAGYLFVGGTLDVAAPFAPLFFGSERERVRAQTTFFAELDLGVTGPIAGGASVQRGIHSLLQKLTHTTDAISPLGWGIYQTSDRAGVDLQLRSETDLFRAGTRVGRLTELLGARFSICVSMRGRLELGSFFDNAGAGFEVRGGLMEAEVPAGDKPWLIGRFYLFAGADGRLVFYDGLISGPLMNGVTSFARAAPTFTEALIRSRAAHLER